MTRYYDCWLAPDGTQHVLESRGTHLEMARALGFKYYENIFAAGYVRVGMTWDGNEYAGVMGYGPRHGNVTESQYTTLWDMAHVAPNSRQREHMLANLARLTVV
jgi:hypothetical protein